MDDITRPISDVIAEVRSEFGHEMATQEVECSQYALTSYSAYEETQPQNNEGILPGPSQTGYHDYTTNGSGTMESSLLVCNGLQRESENHILSQSQPVVAVESDATSSSVTNVQAHSDSGSIGYVATSVQSYTCLQNGGESSRSDVHVSTTDTQRPALTSADVNHFNSTQRMSAVFDRLHSKYKTHLSHLNLYLAANSIMAKASIAAAATTNKQNTKPQMNDQNCLISGGSSLTEKHPGDTGQRGYPYDMDNSKLGSEGSYHQDLSSSISHHPETGHVTLRDGHMFQESLSQQALGGCVRPPDDAITSHDPIVKPLQSVRNEGGAGPTPSPDEDRPLGFTALNAKENVDMQISEKATQSTEQVHLVESAEEDGGGGGEDDDEESISDTEVQPVQPGVQSEVQPVQPGVQSEVQLEQPGVQSEVQPVQPGVQPVQSEVQPAHENSQLKRILLGIEKSTLEERVENFLSQSTIKMNDVPSQRGLGGLLNERAWGEGDVPIPASKVPGCMMEGRGSDLCRPQIPVTEVSIGGPTLRQATQTQGVCQSEHVGNGKEAVHITSGLENTGVKKIAIENMNADLQKLERITNLLACRPKFSKWPTAANNPKQQQPQASNNVQQDPAYTDSTSNYRTTSGGSFTLGNSSEYVPYTNHPIQSPASVSWLDSKSSATPQHTSSYNTKSLQELPYGTSNGQENMYGQAREPVTQNPLPMSGNYYTGYSETNAAHGAYNTGHTGTSWQNTSVDRENSHMDAEQMVVHSVPDGRDLPVEDPDSSIRIAKSDVMVLGKVDSGGILNTSGKTVASKPSGREEHDGLSSSSVMQMSNSDKELLKQKENNDLFTDMLKCKLRDKRSGEAKDVVKPGEESNVLVQNNSTRLIDHQSCYNYTGQGHHAQGDCYPLAVGNTRPCEEVRDCPQDINANHTSKFYYVSDQERNQQIHNAPTAAYGSSTAQWTNGQQPQQVCHTTAVNDKGSLSDQWTDGHIGGKGIAHHSPACSEASNVRNNCNPGEGREEMHGKYKEHTPSNRDLKWTPLNTVVSDYQDHNEWERLLNNTLQQNGGQLGDGGEARINNKGQIAGEEGVFTKHKAQPRSSLCFINYSNIQHTTGAAGTIPGPKVKRKRKVKKRQKEVPLANHDSHVLSNYGHNSAMNTGSSTNCPPNGNRDDSKLGLTSVRERGKIKCVISKQVVEDKSASGNLRTTWCSSVTTYNPSTDQETVQHPNKAGRRKDLTKVGDGQKQTKDFKTNANVMAKLDRKQIRELTDDALKKTCAVVLDRREVGDWYRQKNGKEQTSEQSVNEKKRSSLHNKDLTVLNPVNSPAKQVISKEKQGEEYGQQLADVSLKAASNQRLAETQLLSENNRIACGELESKTEGLEDSLVQKYLDVISEGQSCNDVSGPENNIFSSLKMTNIHDSAEKNLRFNDRLPGEDNPDYVYEGVSEEFLLEQIAESERSTPSDPQILSIDTGKADAQMGDRISTPLTALSDSNIRVAATRECKPIPSPSSIQSEVDVSNMEKSSDPENDLVLITSNMRKKRKKSSKGSVSSSSSDRGQKNNANHGFLKVVLKKPRLVVENTPLPSPTSSTHSAMFSESSTDLKSFLPEPFAEHKMVCGGQYLPSSSTEDAFEGDCSPFSKAPSPLKLEQQRTEENVLSTRSGRVVRRSIPDIKETILESSFASVVLLGKQFEFCTGRVSSNLYGQPSPPPLLEEKPIENNDVPQREGRKGNRKGKRSRKVKNKDVPKVDVQNTQNSVPSTDISKSFYKLSNGETVASGNGFSWDNMLKQISMDNMSSEKCAKDCPKLGDNALEISSVSQASIISEQVEETLRKDHVVDLTNPETNDINVCRDTTSNEQSSNVNSTESLSVNDTESTEIRCQKAASSGKKRRSQGLSYRKRKRYRSAARINKTNDTTHKEPQIKIRRIHSVTETSDYFISFINEVTAQIKPKVPDPIENSIQPKAQSIIPSGSQCSVITDNEELEANKSCPVTKDTTMTPPEKPSKTKRRQKTNTATSGTNTDSEIRNLTPTPDKMRNLFSDIGDITTLSKDLEKHSISEDSISERKNSHSEVVTNSKFLDISSGPDDESGDDDPVVEHHVYPQDRSLHSPSRIKSNPFAPKNWQFGESAMAENVESHHRLACVLKSKADHDRGNDADTETDTEADQQMSCVQIDSKVNSKAKSPVLPQQGQDTEKDVKMQRPDDCDDEVNKNKILVHKDGKCVHVEDRCVTIKMATKPQDLSEKEGIGLNKEHKTDVNENLGNKLVTNNVTEMQETEDKDIDKMQDAYNNFMESDAGIEDEEQCDKIDAETINKVDANQNEKQTSETLQKMASNTVLQLKDFIMPPSITPLSRKNVATDDHLESSDKKSSIQDHATDDPVEVSWSEFQASLIGTGHDKNSSVQQQSTENNPTMKEEGVMDFRLSESYRGADTQVEQSLKYVPSISKETWHIIDEVKSSQTFRTNEAKVDIGHSYDTQDLKQKDYTCDYHNRLNRHWRSSSCTTDSFNSSLDRLPSAALSSDRSTVNVEPESALDLSKKEDRTGITDVNSASVKNSESEVVFPVIDTFMAERAANVVRSVQDLVGKTDTNPGLCGSYKEAEVSVLKDLDELRDITESGKQNIVQNKCTDRESQQQVYNTEKCVHVVPTIKSQVHTEETQEMNPKLASGSKKNSLDFSSNLVVNIVKNSHTTTATESGTSHVNVKSENNEKLCKSKTGALDSNNKIPLKDQSAFNTLCGIESSISGQKDPCKLVGVVNPCPVIGLDHQDGSSSDLFSSSEDSEDMEDDPMLEQMIFAHDLVVRLEGHGGQQFACHLCRGRGEEEERGGQYGSVLAVIQHVLQTHCYCQLCSQGYPEVYAYQGHIWSQHADDEDLIRNARKLAKFRSSDQSLIPTPPKVRHCYSQTDNISSATYSCTLCGKTTDSISKVRSHVARYHLKKAYCLIRRRKRAAQLTNKDLHNHL